jgi:hypothetical protein
MLISGCVPEYEEDRAVAGAFFKSIAGIKAYSSAMGVDWPSEREKWADWQSIIKNQFDVQRGLKIQNPTFFRVGFVSDLEPDYYLAF